MFVYQYPHPAVTTDCVIFGLEDGLLKVLLVERGDEPCKGCWAFPGGFLNPDETVEQGALRELQEETGLDSAYMEQVGVFSDPDRDPRERVITVAFFSVMHVKNVRAGDDAAKAKWLPVNDLPELAFDHDRILKTALKRFRERLVIEPDFLRKMPDSFSEKEMENVKNGISLHY
ncbi:MAG: NUDIX hydrolase [Bacteroidales bacterium]|nr:NUDIX hydrolase [Bacteroidales bacterium]